MPDVDPVLSELAAAFGAATEYWDWRGRHVEVAAETLTAVLAALGVDTSSEQSRAAALDRRRSEAWRSVFPPYVVAREGVCLLYTSDAADDLLCVDLGGP